MVAKFVASVRRMPWRMSGLLCLLVLIPFLALRLRPASGGTFTSHYWTNTSPSPRCICDDCGCERPSETYQGVSKRTGELSIVIPLFTTPGMLTTHAISLMWTSMNSGKSEFGNRVIPSWENTMKAVSGSVAEWRRPDGLMVTWTRSGSVWSTTDCNVHETLTTNGSGNFVLTGLRGDVMTFDANGMPASYADANSNALTFTYSSLKLSTIVDDRGQTILTAHHDANDFIDYVDTPVGRFTFALDSSDNLITVTAPATADQGSGITTTLAYDGSNRLTGVQNGNGDTPWTYSYVSSTDKVSVITGSTIQFSYATGRTNITDRLGNVHRTFYTGSTITSEDLYESSVSKYATTYTYNGNDLVTIVKPLGNRIDFTRDGNGNLTERRQKTTNTGSNSGTDIVDSWTYSSNFMATHTDPLGNVTTYGRDGVGNLTSISYATVTHPTTQSSVSKSFTLNGSGQVTQVTDEDGKIVGYEYYSSGARTGLLWKTKVDPSGLNLITTYDYDSAFNRTTVTDPLSHVTTTTFDSQRRVTEVEDPMGVQIQSHYDAIGQLTSRDVENLDKDGNSVSGNGWLTTSYTYSVHGDLLTTTEEIDSTHTRTTSFDYDANQNRIRVTKPEGNKDKWTYNSRDLVATHIRGETSGVASTETYTYDDNGNLTDLEDGRGNHTTYTYDAFDRRTKTTNALSHYEEQDYDKAGNVTEIRRKDSSNNLLQRSTRSFDERNRLYEVSELYKDPSTTYSDAVTTTERFKTGHVRYVTDARSKVTETQYDAAWRVSKTIDAMGNEAANTYDAAGRRTAWTLKEIDGGSSVTHAYGAGYDDAGHMTSRTETDRNNGANVYTTSFGYDSRGNLVWQVNAEGNPTRFTFDGLSRMTKKEVALAYGSPITTFTSSIDTQWGFDKNNRLVSFKDDAANESTWAYDAKDRQTSMTYPDSSSIAYVYDENDNVTQVTDAAGNVISDTFDALNRNTARSISLATGFVGTTSESRSFDALNRVLTNDNNDYKLTYTYGVRGLASTVYEEKQEYATGTAYQKVVTTKYDAVGNRTYEAYPSGLTLTYAYNDINALSSVTDGTNSIASMTYVGFRPKVTTFGNSTTATYSYGGFREDVTTIHHETSTPTTLVKLDYGYNKLHDRTYERYGSSGAPGDAFEYDKARRLTKAWMGSSTPASPSGNTYVKTIVYNMDDDGNRTSVVTTPYGVSPTTESYTTNTLNQYTAVGGASPTYDSNGNLTNNGTYKFKYSYKNLICEARLSSNNNLVATYTFDAAGRRVGKAVSGGITQRFILADVETIETFDGSNTWKQDYAFDVTGVDRVLMLEQADVLDQDGDANTTESTRSYYHRNAVGSVIEMSSEGQTEAVSLRYEPYGEVLISRGGIAQSVDPLGQDSGFMSRPVDSETKTNHFRARDVSVREGRFLQRDPVSYRGGQSLYEFVGSLPVNRTDPMGTSWIDAARDAVAAVAEALVEAAGAVAKACTKGHCECHVVWHSQYGADPTSNYEGTPNVSLDGWLVLSKSTCMSNRECVPACAELVRAAKLIGGTKPRDRSAASGGAVSGEKTFKMTIKNFTATFYSNGESKKFDETKEDFIRYGDGFDFTADEKNCRCEK